MALPKFRVLRWVVPVAVLLIAAAVTHSLWLAAIGDFLVAAQEPFKADVVVVLAGGWRGNRILKAAELVRQGFATRILVSGPDGHYGVYESDLAIPFAVRNGYPREWFVPLPNRSRSTREEARDVAAELRRRHVRRFILVTSDYHTRRARAVYRKMAPGIEFRTVAAPDPDFPRKWWQTRQGQKTVFLEWVKTVAYWLGL